MSNKKNTTLPLTNKIIEIVNYCNNCGQCNLTCSPHFFGIFNPLGIIRDIQRENIEIAIKNQPIYNCLTCNRCMINCPTSRDGEGMNFAMLIRYLRQYAVEKDIIPKNKPNSPGHCSVIHETADLENLPISNVLKYFKNYPHLKISEKGPIAYFIEDLPSIGGNYKKFGADLQQIPRSVVKILNQMGIEPVVLNLKGSGHDDLWVGNQKIFEKIAKYNTDELKKAGVKTVIVEGAEAFRTLKFDYPSAIPDFNFKVLHLSEYLINNGGIKKLKLNAPINATYTIQDVSRMGRLGGHVYEPLRTILNKLPSLNLIEMESNHEDADSYGCAPYLTINEDTKKMWINNFRKIQKTKSDYIVTTSPKSLLHYNYVINEILNGKEGAEDAIPMKDWAVFLSRFLR